MPRKYDNPPLVEAVCEFQFLSDENWDLTFPGLIYERIKDGFPRKKQVTRTSLRVPAGIPAPAVSEDVVDRVQFYSKDEKALIQVGPNLLAVNALRPFFGWEELRRTALDKMNVYREICNPRGLRRVGIRYINEILIPGNRISLAEYALIGPFAPQGEGQELAFFHVEGVRKFQDPTMLLRFAFATSPSKDEKARFILDLDVFGDEEVAPEFSALSIWMDKAHERLESFFDSSFTPKAHRDIFKEVGSR